MATFCCPKRLSGKKKSQGRLQRQPPPLRRTRVKDVDFICDAKFYIFYRIEVFKLGEQRKVLGVNIPNVCHKLISLSNIATHAGRILFVSVCVLLHVASSYQANIYVGVGATMQSYNKILYQNNIRVFFHYIRPCSNHEVITILPKCRHTVV